MDRIRRTEPDRGESDDLACRPPKSPSPSTTPRRARAQRRPTPRLGTAGVRRRRGAGGRRAGGDLRARRPAAPAAGSRRARPWQGRAGRRGRGDCARASSTARDEAFSEAADGSRSLWLTLADAIPFVGNTPEAIRAVADAGVQTADAAEGLAAAVADLPGGLGALAPTAEGIPIDRLAALTEATARADELTGSALATLAVRPHGVRPRPPCLRARRMPRPSWRSCTASCTRGR